MYVKRAVNILVNVEGRDKGLFSEEDFIVVNCMCESVFENEENQSQSHLCMRIFIKK